MAPIRRPGHLGAVRDDGTFEWHVPRWLINCAIAFWILTIAIGAAMYADFEPLPDCTRTRVHDAPGSWLQRLLAGERRHAADVELDRAMMAEMCVGDR